MSLQAKKTRLLLIEDNTDTRQIYKDVFEREGFEVLQAEDGEKGLSYAQATIPDVILLDLMLPKISGFELLKKLRANTETKDIPVMIFSALADPADRKKAAALGVTEYSVKALNPLKHVVSRVRAILTQQQQAIESGSELKAFMVSMKEGVLDAAQLVSEIGLKNGFHCVQCGAEVILSMLPDRTRMPGHWFVARPMCSGCHTTY